MTGQVSVVEVKARERSQIGHLPSERNAEIGREGWPGAVRSSVAGHQVVGEIGAAVR